MKIVFVLPSIKNNGGVARVTTLKANYLVETWKYDVHIICQDEEKSNSFFDLNSKITLHYVPKKDNPFTYLYSFYKSVSLLLKEINAKNAIIVDNGFKGFMLPFFVKISTNLIFEVHGSRFENITKKISLKTSILNSFRVFGLKKYKKVLFLNKESAKEWNFQNPLIVSNPLPFQTNKTSTLKNKKVICVARHSHEKGLDSLLKIWKNVSKDNLEWNLEIYGEETAYSKYLYEVVENLNIQKSVLFKKPIQNIQDVYLNASVLAMTSRYEGFGLVLIEAMSCGLPVIAFDCEIGPRTIIEDSVNGFLIEFGDNLAFEKKLNAILKQEIDLNNLIKNGLEKAQEYDLLTTFQIWKEMVEANYKLL